MKAAGERGPGSYATTGHCIRPFTHVEFELPLLQHDIETMHSYNYLRTPHAVGDSEWVSSASRRGIVAMNIAPAYERPYMQCPRASAASKPYNHQVRSTLFHGMFGRTHYATIVRGCLQPGWLPLSLFLHLLPPACSVIGTVNDLCYPEICLRCLRMSTCRTVLSACGMGTAVCARQHLSGARSGRWARCVDLQDVGRCRDAVNQQKLPVVPLVARLFGT